MEKAISSIPAGEDARSERGKVRTTLYDLIAAVSEVVEPDEERLIVQVVWRMLRLSQEA